MTGKHNYKNYEYFTYLNPNQKTFGNLFKENGYKTAVVGNGNLTVLNIRLRDLMTIKDLIILVLMNIVYGN